jgi:hypothetical protein
LADDQLESCIPIETLALAFSQHPAIRNTYIHVFVMCSLQGSTWQMAAQMLEDQKAMLSSLVTATPGLDIYELDKFAVTLPTVEHHFWVDPDVCICYYILCDVCGVGWATIPRSCTPFLESRQGGKWGIEDVDVHCIHQRFVSLPCGLVGQINLDW